MNKQARLRAEALSELPFVSSGTLNEGVFKGFVRSVAEIGHRRELLGLLVRRELKSRYKDSSLGFVWSLIKPLTMLLIYFVAIGQFLGAARGIPDFAIFVYSGLTVWGLYSEIVLGGTSSILNNAGLIKKVYLPREIFPLAATGSALFNFVVQFLILVVFTVILGRAPLSWSVFYALGGVIIAVIYGVALALLLSALNVYLRDIQYLVDVALAIFFWASPIVYAWSFVVQAGARTGLDWLSTVYLLNPVSLAVLAFQRGMWISGSHTVVNGATTVAPQPWPADMGLRMLIAALVGLILLAVAQRVFSRLQGNFAQEI